MYEFNPYANTIKTGQAKIKCETHRDEKPLNGAFSFQHLLNLIPHSPT